LVLIGSCVDETCSLLQMCDVLLITYYNHFTTRATLFEEWQCAYYRLVAIMELFSNTLN